MLQSHSSLPVNDPLLVRTLLHPAYSLHSATAPATEPYSHLDSDCYFQLGHHVALYQSILQTPPTVARNSLSRSEFSAFDARIPELHHVPPSCASSSVSHQNPPSLSFKTEEAQGNAGEPRTPMASGILRNTANSAALIINQLTEQIVRYARQRQPNPSVCSENTWLGPETTRRLAQLLYLSYEAEEGNSKSESESLHRQDQTDTPGCIDLSLPRKKVNRTSSEFADTLPKISRMHESDGKRIPEYLTSWKFPGPGSQPLSLVGKGNFTVSPEVHSKEGPTQTPFIPQLFAFDPLELRISPPSSTLHTMSEMSADESVPSYPFVSSAPSVLSKPLKNRKSGFQAGVTVGYTYDAFFISDGRSRRRGKSKAKRTIRRLRDESGLLSMSSSSGHSNCSTASSSHDAVSEIVTPKTSPCSPGKNTPNRLLFVAASCPMTEQCTQRYSCPDCGKSYATSSNLSRHKQTHRSLDSQAARKCPHCGKAYVSMPALSMHILTHDLKHRCDLCGKAFSRPWLLQGHRRAHTGEKPYGCAHCGRAFADRSNLRAHMQTHSGMKQYECKRCHKNFALKSYLNKHLESACTDRMTPVDPYHQVISSSTELCSGSVESDHSAPELPWSVSKLIGGS